MKTITDTYYVCQYCGYKDTDEASMRKHESVCKGKVDIGDLVGKWVQISDYLYFKVISLKNLSGDAEGIEIGKNWISYHTYPAHVLVNKPVSNGYQKYWNEWKKKIEG